MSSNLFGLPRAASGKYAGQFVKWFSRKGKGLGYIERRGIESRGRMPELSEVPLWSKSFHSFRHSAIESVKAQRGGAQGIQISDIALTFGHAGDDLSEADQKALDAERALMTNRYGSVDPVSENLVLRQKVINAIRYDAVDFCSIRWKLQA